MGRFQSFAVPSFLGVNEDENPHALKPWQLRMAENVWFLGNSIGTRPGTVREPDSEYAAAVTGNLQITGLVDFWRNRDADRSLVAVCPGAIFVDDTTTLDIATNSVTITNAAKLPWTFAEHKNILYAAGGDLTTDVAWYWDPTIGAGDEITPLGILNLSGTGVEPRYIYQWNNQLFACGFNSSDASANPGVTRFSSLNDGTTWPTDYTFGGNFTVGGFEADSSEFLTGFGEYAQGGKRWLLQLSNRRVYAVEGIGLYPYFRIVDEIPNGAYQNTFINLGVDAGDAVYMSHVGVHSLRQSQTYGEDESKFISWPIRQTFATINKSRMNQIVSAYWPSYGVAAWAVPTGANTQNDTILFLHMRDLPDGALSSDTARWTIVKLAGTNHRASAMLGGRSSDGTSQLYFGTYAGNVCAFSTANYADLSTNAYTAKFATKYTDFDAPTRAKTLGSIYVDLGPGGGFNPYFQATFDFGREPHTPIQLQMQPAGALWDAATWDTDNWAEGSSVFRNKLYGVGAGDVVSFSVQHSGLNEPFYVHGIYGEIALAGEGAES